VTIVFFAKEADTSLVMKAARTKWVGEVIGMDGAAVHKRLLFAEDELANVAVRNWRRNSGVPRQGLLSCCCC
jgi:hypothetical protein